MMDFDLPRLGDGFGLALAEVLDEPRGALLLCRHSIRGRIPLDPQLRDVPLLDPGRQLCRDLGAKHGWPFERAWSSPMLRCRESLSAYQQGARRELELQRDARLGAPGAFVVDPEQAWEDYKLYRKHELVRRLYVDPPSVSGYRGLASGVRLLLSCFVERPCDRPAIACSHDIIMSALLSWAFDRPWERGDWPDFFEGIALWVAPQSTGRGYRVRVAYRGKSIERDLLARSTLVVDDD